MSLEIHLENVDATIFSRRPADKRPDIVEIGSGERFAFYRYCKPRVGGNRAAVYKLATVESFDLLHLSKKD